MNLEFLRNPQPQDFVAMGATSDPKTSDRMNEVRAAAFSAAVMLGTLNNDFNKLPVVARPLFTTFIVTNHNPNNLVIMETSVGTFYALFTVQNPDRTKYRIVKLRIDPGMKSDMDVMSEWMPSDADEGVDFDTEEDAARIVTQMGLLCSMDSDLLLKLDNSRPVAGGATH